MKTKVLFFLFLIPLPLFSQWVQLSNGSNNSLVNLDSSVYKAVNVLIKYWPVFKPVGENTPGLPIKIFISDRSMGIEGRIQRRWIVRDETSWRRSN